MEAGSQKASELHLTVNGRTISLPAIDGEKLADLLRKRLGLTGTKVGCGEGRCGACTVLLDGIPVRSCVFPAKKASGKSILTIEGLSGRTLEDLHPLQAAFVAHGAVQCGFCSPGMILTAFALLQKNRSPSREGIRKALRRNLCRCGGYPSIEEAVLAAAEALRTGEPVAKPVVTTTDDGLRIIGKPLIRPDAVEKVTGRAIFTDDLTFEGMLFARVRRAGVPHAILSGLNVAEALAVPGVVCVLTAAEIPGEHTHGLVTRDWPVMVGIGERIRYVGDALAILAAQSQEAADQAVSLIAAELDPLPVVVDSLQALQADAPQLHPDGNLLKHIKVRKGDPDQGFSEADITLEQTFHTPPMDHAFLEPECSLAVPGEDGRIAIYVGSQIPYADREQVARVLDISEGSIRIIGQTMGGGFGGKEDIAGQIHSALLAQATGKPVKLLFDRAESMLVHPKRHATRITVRVGARSSGALTAVETVLYGDTGAYASLGEKVMERATTHSAGPYSIPHSKADCFATFTNNPPAGAFRGFGVLQASFAIESTLDMLAHKLGMDPFAIRRLNALQAGSRTNTDQVLQESVGLIECLDRVEAQLHAIAGHQPFIPDFIEDEAGRFGRAWGIAAAFKNTGLGTGERDASSAAVALLPDGCLEVRTSAAELGQGLVTVLRMIVAEEFNLDPERVRVLVMDTDRTPDGGPTTASRQTYVTGNAARHAARDLREDLRAALSEQFGCPQEEIHFAEGEVRVGTRVLLGLRDAAKMLAAAGKPLCVVHEYVAPETVLLGEDGPIHFAFSFAVQAVQIEVNLKTGAIRVLKVITANDAGRVINPLGFKGQVEGGVMMGIGHALLEEFVLDQGQVLTQRLSQYPLPTIQDIPEIIAIAVEHPTREGPYGAKGIGEIVSIPTPPAIANAVYNAVGLRVSRLPIRQQDILSVIE